MILNNRSHICMSINQSTNQSKFKDKNDCRVIFQEARDELETQKYKPQDLRTQFFACFNDLN